MTRGIMFYSLTIKKLGVMVFSIYWGHLPIQFREISLLQNNFHLFLRNHLTKIIKKKMGNLEKRQNLISKTTKDEIDLWNSCLQQTMFANILSFN